MSGWIAVDLDGTLALYDHFRGPTVIGAPIERMVYRVKVWLMQGWDVRIFTARVACEGPDREIVEKAIKDWCKKHIGVELPVTNVKDYGMVELWDDRAVQMIPNTGKRADGQS